MSAGYTITVTKTVVLEFLEYPLYPDDLLDAIQEVEQNHAMRPHRIVLPDIHGGTLFGIPVEVAGRE